MPSGQRNLVRIAAVNSLLTETLPEAPAASNEPLASVAASEWQRPVLLFLSHGLQQAGWLQPVPCMLQSNSLQHHPDDRQKSHCCQPAADRVNPLSQAFTSRVSHQTVR